MNIDERIAEYKADIEKCERVCEVTAIGSIREAATKKAKDCKQMVEWLEDYKRLKAGEKHKKDTLDKMRNDIMKLQTYKMFPYEATVYVERDEVMKIFEKHTEGDEGNADSD